MNQTTGMATATPEIRWWFLWSHVHTDKKTQVFSPERLRLARQRRGLLVQELAVQVQVSPRSVSAWENNKKTPNEDNVTALAKVLNFPRAFFFRDGPPSLSRETFRSLARMTARQRDMARAAGIQAIELDLWIDQHFQRPVPRVPDFRDAAAETAAELVRTDWSLGYRPLPNSVHLLEKNGVRVYSLVHDGVEVDAFSGWCGNTPYVFLNTTKTAERSRMDAAHELGHLVLHLHAGGGTKKQEDEAQAFAAAFLMPRAPFLSSAPRRVSLAAVIEAKREWGVSAAAYAYRLHALGAIPYWHYRDLCIKLRSRYGSTEPGHTLIRETSQVLAKVIGTKESGGATRRGIANDLLITLRDLDEMTFGLTLTSLKGGGQTTHPTPNVGDIRLLK